MKREPRKIITLRVNEDERKLFQKNADRFTGGNVGSWLRMVGAYPNWEKSKQVKLLVNPKPRK